MTTPAHDGDDLVITAAEDPARDEFLMEETAWDRAYASRDGGALNALLAGDADSYRSKSDADHALATILFRAFGEDRAKVEEALRASGINPTKYGRRDYVDRTLRAAAARARALGSYPLPSAKQLTLWNRPTALAEREATYAAPTPQPLRLLTLEELGNPLLLRVPDAIGPWLTWRGELTYFPGREKLGKSTCAASDAARSGRPFLWVTAEESRGRVVKRLRDLGIPLTAMLVPDRWPRSWEEVETLVADTRPDAVYVDSLASFLAAVGERIPETSEGERWHGLMIRFKRWTTLGRHADEPAAGVCVLEHATKEDGSYRGSTGKAAAVDTIVTMRAGEEQARRLETVGRWGFPSRTVRFVSDAAGYEETELGRPDETEENARLVIEAYEPGISGKDWQDRTRLPRTTFHRARSAAMAKRADGTWGVRPGF